MSKRKEPPIPEGPLTLHEATALSLAAEAVLTHRVDPGLSVSTMRLLQVAQAKLLMALLSLSAQQRASAKGAARAAPAPRPRKVPSAAPRRPGARKTPGKQRAR